MIDSSPAMMNVSFDKHSIATSHLIMTPTMHPKNYGSRNEMGNGIPSFDITTRNDGEIRLETGEDTPNDTIAANLKKFSPVKPTKQMTDKDLMKTLNLSNRRVVKNMPKESFNKMHDKSLQLDLKSIYTLSN